MAFAPAKTKSCDSEQGEHRAPGAKLATGQHDPSDKERPDAHSEQVGEVPDNPSLVTGFQERVAAGWMQQTGQDQGDTSCDQNRARPPSGR